MSDEAAKLFGLLQGDCHSHSDWSDGGSPIREMAEAAKEIGHRYWALTDHSPRLTIAHGLDAERLRSQLDVVAELNAELAPFRILTGIEVDILEDGSLDQDDELLGPARCRRGQRPFQAADGRRGDDHVGCCGPYGARTPTSWGTARAASWPDGVDPSRPSTPRPCSGPARRPERLSRSTPGRSDSIPRSRCSTLALDLDCVVVVDTDAHAPGQLEWQRNGCEQAARVGVPPDRVMNTLPMDEFLAWTAGHAGLSHAPASCAWVR